MNPITHYLSGWAIAGAHTSLTPRERAAITLAGVVPDLDGMGVIWDLASGSGKFELYQRYHHVFGHNVFFGLLVVVCGYLLGVRNRLAAALLFLSFQVHLLGDIVGARGQGDDVWAVPYFWPASTREFFWHGQWPLNGWQNFLITGVLLALMFFLAVKRGYSPLEMISSRADLAFVRTIRSRFSS